MHLHITKGIIVKTILRTAPLALSLFLGLVQSASAGVMQQEITLSSKLGSTPLPGFSAKLPDAVPPPAVVAPAVVPPAAVPAPVMPAVVVPAPGRLLPIEFPVAPVPMPAEVPAALDDPATVPEPGTVGTLAAGLALMGAIARRRRRAR